MKVDINKADLVEAKAMLRGVGSATPRIQARSINKTLTAAKTIAAKEVVKAYNLTQTRVKKDLYLQKATFSNPKGAFIARGKPLSLTTFRNTRQVAKGVSVQVRIDRPRWVWRHAFIRTVNNSKQAFYRPLPPGIARSSRLYKVWKRSDKYGVLPRIYRYGLRGVIYRLTGPRIEDELGKPQTLTTVRTQIGDRFDKIVDQEINFELSKL